MQGDATVITPDYMRAMAAYNRWQNGNLFGAAGTLNDAARRDDRGAFFHSIHSTLNHLLWADGMWMSRLAGLPRPHARSIAESVDECETWEELAAARPDLDAAIVAWAETLTADDMAGTLSWYSKATGREITRPRWLLYVHLINHQTHHRGQVHAMLTAAGARPGDTDLPFMPDDA